jgi:3-hydroxyacyl-CoA dehydrogenase/enoyl-CoA hydratase/3-hydroxybutyryl-CoA epimerase
MSAFSLAERDGVLVLRFDRPDQKVNLLDGPTLDELEQRLDEIATRRDAKALLIESGKPGTFIAGADVRLFASIADAATGEAAARRGQAVFAKLAALPMPAVALIHGACVGGGLELSLACRARVASDDPATKLGLPEVQLGILPGFGGTQRLPALVGLLAALPLLLTGRRLGGKAARRIGLVDEVAPRERLREAALRVVARAPKRRLPSALANVVESLVRSFPPARRFILERARRSVRARAGDRYPAPLRILDAVEAGYAARARDGGLGTAGFEVEARLLGELLTGTVARNLVRLYLLSESAPGDKDDARAIERAFVAGAGQMGAGIAALFAGAGVRTRLHDAAGAALARGTAKARELLRRRFKDDVRAARAAIDRLDPSPGQDGLARCDVVLEAVLEKLDLKQKLFAELEPKVPESTLLATNTSSLDLDALAGGLARKERFVGLHFFHPTESMRLVEVVRAAATSEPATARACAIAKRLGKVPVVVANRPGFLVNRLLSPYLLEAERLVGEGVPIPALDRAMRQAGMPMGPIELLDEVGLDVALAVGAILRAGFPDRPEPFAEAGLVRRLVAAGQLGKKSGRGFYLHGRRRVPAPEFRRRAARPMDAADWVDRLVLPVVAEAFRCLDERIVASGDELDLAMCLGAGFLVADGGPIRFARARGLPSVVAALDRLAERHGRRFAAPASLRGIAR